LIIPQYFTDSFTKARLHTDQWLYLQVLGENLVYVMALFVIATFFFGRWEAVRPLSAVRSDIRRPRIIVAPTNAAIKMLNSREPLPPSALRCSKLSIQFI
jgi:hypothetical protein